MNKLLMRVANLLLLAMLLLVVACSSSSDDVPPMLSISVDGVELAGSALNFMMQHRLKLMFIAIRNGECVAMRLGLN